MGSFTIYKEDGNDSTVISNRFIDAYMKDANDAQIKVYLYLLRMMGAGLSTSVSDIADHFNHTEKDVLRALKYWESRGLLALDFNAARTLTGIRILELAREAAPAANVNSNPVTLAPVVSLKTLAASRAGTAPVCAPKESGAAASFEKPAYTADDIRCFEQRENTAQLLFIAEQYLGRTLKAADIRSLFFFSDKLHFTDDLIDYLLQYCVDRGKRDFRFIETVAVAWAQAGITTPEEAMQHVNSYNKDIYLIMKALGKSSAPTQPEVEYIARWEKDYGFTPDIILEACRRTVLATDKHRFEYAESILSSWKKAGVRRREDIEKADEGYKASRRENGSRKTGSKDWFNQFDQRDYDFEALEKELLSN